MFLDSSAVIEVLMGGPLSGKMRAMAERETSYLSEISIAEVADWAIKSGIPPLDRVERLKQVAHVVSLGQDDMIEGARIKRSMRDKGRQEFGLVDGIVLSAARSTGQKLLTLDGHFAGEEDCVVFK